MLATVCGPLFREESSAISESHSVEADDAGVVELVDVEECGKAGRKPPKARRYRIRIDKQHYEVEASSMTGRELLVLAGKSPPERYTISQKLHGGQTVTIGLADFTTPGVERFMTLPLDQTEG